MSELVEVCCPACFESFSIVAPETAALPTELDYDCEICCRPMVIMIEQEEDGEGEEGNREIWASARSLDE